MTPTEWLGKALVKNFPGLFLRGVFAFRVTEYVTGRINLQPVKATWLKDITLADTWSGIGGSATRPKIGSQVLIAFVDADETDPVIVSFAPLSVTRPDVVTVDADEVDIGPDAASVVLAGQVSDSVILGAETGRVVRYGDVIQWHGTNPASPILAGIPGPNLVSRVKA